ncbi:hypothetical protein COE55_20485 [Priestia megaterium]|nr:hypothetical protein COE55_20485 [Priestia megaterium]
MPISNNIKYNEQNTQDTIRCQIHLFRHSPEELSYSHKVVFSVFKVYKIYNYSLHNHHSRK